MGYRSEVALALSKNGKVFMEAKLAEGGINAHMASAFLKRADKSLANGDGAMLYYWYCIKWYDGFGEVQFLTDCMENMPAYDYRFIRLGEDWDDPPEFRGEFDDPFSLGIDRRICSNID